MKTPRRWLFPAILGVGVCLAVGVGWLKWRENRFFETAALLSHFPAEDAAVMRIDFQALRSGGYLTRSGAPLEPEYSQFLDGTGFDYRRDLDLAIASFSASGNYFIARGRFDWKKLREYVARQGGSCYRDLCRIQGSTPERHISFLPLRSDAIALAVSTDDLAASRLTGAAKPVDGPLPAGPVWLSVPGTLFRARGVLPEGMRVMFSGLMNAERVTILLAPDGVGAQAKLEATCRTQDDARVLASQLRSVTSALKESLARNPEARNDALALLLGAGHFDQAERRVSGTWPVGRKLLDHLTSGI